MTTLYLLLIAYLLGAIPTGVILTFFMTDIDIRQAGSGNIGATNVTRLTGWKLGGLTLLGDAGKGVLATLLAVGLQVSPVGVGLVALAAFLGHCYPVYLDFKGGKGVAVALGIFLVLSPVSIALAFLVWLAVVEASRRASLGALVAAPCLPILQAMVPGESHWWPLGVAVVGMLVWRHKDNLRRLRAGEEQGV